MGKKVRSAMGVVVDFDALKIKQQLSTTPATTKVVAREQYVEDRANRRAVRRASNKAKQVQLALQKSEPILPVDDDLTDEERELEAMIAEEIIAEEIVAEEIVAEEIIAEEMPDSTSTTRKQQRKVKTDE